MCGQHRLHNRNELSLFRECIRSTRMTRHKLAHETILAVAKSVSTSVPTTDILTKNSRDCHNLPTNVPLYFSENQMIFHLLWLKYVL